MDDFQVYMRNALKNIQFTDQVTELSVPYYDVADDVKNLVIEERDKAGMTQVDLAHKTGISQANISRIERGQTLPNLNTLKKIADAVDKRLVIKFEDFEEDDNG